MASVCGACVFRYVDFVIVVVIDVALSFITQVVSHLQLYYRMHECVCVCVTQDLDAITVSLYYAVMICTHKATTARASKTPH